MNFQNTLLRAYISADLKELHNLFHLGYHPNPIFELEQFPGSMNFRFRVYADDMYTFTGIYFEIKSMTTYEIRDLENNEDQEKKD